MRRGHTHGDIAGEHTAGDGCEATDHDGQKFRLGHALQEGLDQERRLGLADKNIGRARERFCAAGAQRPAHEVRHRFDHLLDDAEIVEHRHEAAEEDDRRQDFEGEQEPETLPAGIRAVIGGVGEIPEQKAGAVVGQIQEVRN